MSDYIYSHYFGKYRIKAHLDESTHDFPKNEEGFIDTDDFYIPCKGGAMISHYGRKVLSIWIPSSYIGHRILKKLYDLNIEVTNIIEGDNEITFRFNSKHIDAVANLAGAQIRGANIRPFSPKNLPRSSYRIPDEDLEEYRRIIKDIPTTQLLLIHTITQNFMDKYLSSRTKEMYKLCMSTQHKEFIHKTGYWSKFLKYLEKNLQNEINKEGNHDSND